MNNIETMKMALEAMESAIKSEDWVVDGACDPDMAITSLRQAINAAEQREQAQKQEPKQDWSMLEAMQESLREHMARIKELKSQLAQQAEPVAWIEHHKAGDNLVWDEPHKGTPLYTSPPPRPVADEFVCSTGLCHYRQPLTDEEINDFFQGMEPNNGFWLSFARAIEAAHGITGEHK